MVFRFLVGWICKDDFCGELARLGSASQEENDDEQMALQLAATPNWYKIEYKSDVCGLLWA